MPIGDARATNALPIAAHPEPHCVDVLEDVQPGDFAIWRNDLVSKARGNTAGRMTGIFDAMYAVAIENERNRSANVIDQILKRLDGQADHYSKEAIDKILHGTKSAREYAYILRYLIARKNGQPVRMEIAKRGHPNVHFGEDEVTP